MNVLLVNPYIYDFTAYDLWLRPLGLLYLAAVLEKYTDCQVFWLDALDRFQEDQPPKSTSDGKGKFPREIVEKPDIYKTIPRNYSRYGLPITIFHDKIENLPDMEVILVTSLMTYWIDGLVFTVDILKQRFAKAKIVLGGILPSLVSPAIINKYLTIDHFCQGPGEEFILHYINQLGGRVYSHPPFGQLDNIPFPAVQHLNSHLALPLLTSRGCPFKCSYCASGLLNNNFRQRDPQHILAEINTMIEAYGTENIVIFDDALLVNKEKRFYPVFEEVRKKPRVKLHTPNGLHIREIDSSTAILLYESGFKTIRLGFESIDSRILANSSYKVNQEQMESAVDNLEKAGYNRQQIEVYLLFGYPGQNINDLEETLWYVREMGVTPRLSYYSPIPGTPDFLYLQKKEVLSAKINLYETNKIYFVYQNSGLSFEDINFLKKLTSQISDPNQ